MHMHYVHIGTYIHTIIQAHLPHFFHVLKTTSKLDSVLQEKYISKYTVILYPYLLYRKKAWISIFACLSLLLEVHICV